MALKERENLVQENLLGDGGIVIRLEDILSGKKLDDAIKLSTKIAEYYLDIFEDRLKTLYDAFYELENKTDRVELGEYYYLMGLTTKDFKDLSYADKVKLFTAYDYAIKNNYGPGEIYERGVFFEEGYTFNDAQNDKDIMATIQSRIPYICKGPERIEVEKKIVEIGSVIERLKDCKDGKICFAINREVLLKNNAKVKKILAEAKAKNYGKIDLVIDDNGANEVDNSFEYRVPYSYTQKEMEKFSSLLFFDLVDGLYFSEFYQESMIPTNREDLWSYYDVFRANMHKSKMVKDIKKADLSPYEAVIFANEQITLSDYTGHATNDEKTRTFLTAQDAKENPEALEQSGKAFVCTGYASYAKAVVDELNNPNLQCMFVPANFHYKKTKRKKYGATHMLLLVKIKDEKYNRDGYYIWDPTWSIVSPELVLCPVEDIKKYDRIYADINHRKISKIATFLITRREDEKTEDEVQNTIYDDYAGKGKPFTLDLFVDALNEMYNKLRASKFDDEEIKHSTNGQLISRLITKTYKDLSVFNPKIAQNKFYKDLRDFFMKHQSEFPDWENNWLDYCKNMEYYIKN